MSNICVSVRSTSSSRPSTKTTWSSASGSKDISTSTTAASHTTLSSAEKARTFFISWAETKLLLLRRRLQVAAASAEPMLASQVPEPMELEAAVGTVHQAVESKSPWEALAAEFHKQN